MHWYLSGPNPQPAKMQYEHMLSLGVQPNSQRAKVVNSLPQVSGRTGGVTSLSTMVAGALRMFQYGMVDVVVMGL